MASQKNIVDATNFLFNEILNDNKIIYTLIVEFHIKG